MAAAGLTVLCAAAGMFASPGSAGPLAQPEVLYEESAPPPRVLPEPPAVNLASLGAPSSASKSNPVQDLDPMLDSLRQESPRRSMLETMLFEQLRAALPEQGSGYLFEKVNLPEVELPTESWTVRYDFPHSFARGRRHAVYGNFDLRRRKAIAPLQRFA